MKRKEHAGGQVCDVTFLGPSYGEAGQGATGLFNENASVIGLLEWGLRLSGFHTSPSTFTVRTRTGIGICAAQDTHKALPSLPPN
jgi:hypothetical protein